MSEFDPNQMVNSILGGMSKVGETIQVIREPVRAGDKLIIPAMQPASETKGHLVRYRVRKGDTLGGIADQFSVSTDELRKWNALKSARVSRGMILRVYTIGGAPEVRPAPKRPAQKKSAPAVKTAASAGAASQKTP